jgi:cellulose synthase/poly-beta-1,6-N-acetylglucosamine synthase-like glycosyltransferase
LNEWGVAYLASSSYYIQVYEILIPSLQDVAANIYGFFSFFQIAPEQMITVLIIPLIFDVPRTVGKALFLILNRAYERLVSAGDEPDPSFNPLVSIIVPAHNEEQVIERSILSLLEQGYARKEIIVVDDGSTDRTYQIADEFARKGLIKLVHREVPSGKKARAVNHGIVFAQGEIVVTVDADTLMEPMSLGRLVDPFCNPRIGAVSGNVRVLNHTNLLSKLQAYEYMLAMEMGRRFQAISGMLMIIPGAAGAIRLKLAKSVGFYDPDTITEDFDITMKVHKTRMKVKFASDAIGWTVVPDSWRDWFRQRSRWTAGQLQTLIKHRNLFFERHFGRIGILAAPDMVLMDIILLFARTVWLLTLPLFYPGSVVQLLVLIFFFYLFNEFTIAVAAVALSPRKGDIVYLLLAPIVVLFYRPLYGFVRMKAYFTEMTKGVSQW